MTLPAFDNVPSYEYTLGPYVAEFCAAAGFAPDEDQQHFLDAVFGYRADGRLAAMSAALISPRQNIKALYTDTVILTTRGWSTMGEIRPGDQVYGSDGQPTTVTGVSPVRHGHDCYRVTSTDGRSVVADAGHLWRVFDSRFRRWEVLTTEDLLAAGLDRGQPRSVVTDGVSYATREYRWQLPRQHAVQSPDADLPLAPYLLGAWLGDGGSQRMCLSSHADDVSHWVEQITQAGFLPTPAARRTCTMIGITTTAGAGRHSRSLAGILRKLGVYGAKAIPESYLTAGASQREALLQGLLDTDGTIHHRSGQVSFTSTTQNLAEGVLYLVRSLGWRAGIRKFTTQLNGVEHGNAHMVSFTPKASDPYRPFRLPRKAERVRDGGRAGRFTLSVRSIEQVPSVPVCCIKVDNEDGVFLAGPDLLPTHNTSSFEMCALGWLYITKEPLVIWSAHEYSTALETHRHLAELIESNPFMTGALKRNGIIRSNGEEGVEMSDGRRLKFKARTRTGGRGLSGDKIVMDEAFALQDTHMGALIPVLSAREAPQILYGSSAGHERSYVLRDIRDRGRIGDDTMAYIEYCDDLGGACQIPDCDHARNRRGCRLDDERRWERANCALDRRISRAVIREERRGMPPAEFARERLGWWDEDPTGGGVFDLVAWEDCTDAKSKVRPGFCAFGIDVTPDRRSASISIAGVREDGLAHVEVVDQRADTGWVIDRAAELDESWEPIGFVVDPASAAGSLISELELAGVIVMQPSQREMMWACGQMYDGVKDGTLRHLGQPELTRAAEGAVAKKYVDGWLLDRRHPNVDITPLTSATQALFGLSSQMDGGGLAPDEVTVARV